MYIHIYICEYICIYIYIYIYIYTCVCIGYYDEDSCIKMNKNFWNAPRYDLPQYSQGRVLMCSFADVERRSPPYQIQVPRMSNNCLAVNNSWNEPLNTFEELRWHWPRWGACSRRSCPTLLDTCLVDCIRQRPKFVVDCTPPDKCPITLGNCFCNMRLNEANAIAITE